MTERTLIRIGAAAAVVGAIAAFVVFALRPVHSGDIIDAPAATLQDILDSDIWLAIHVVMLSAILLILGSLGALSRSITAQPAAAWGRLGFVAAAIGTAVFLVAIGFGAVGIEGVAELWEDARGTETEAAALVTAQAFDHVDLGIFGMATTLFFGVTTVLYGLGISTSGVYPRWLGWSAIVVGLGAIAAGLNQAFVGGGGAFFLIVLPVFPWLVVMGVFLWRRAGKAT